MSRHDVIIVGAGLVGAACALALARAGLTVAVVEGQAPVAPPADDSWDARVYALSPASVAWLTELGVWARLPAARVGCIENMAVYGDDGKSRLDFSALDAGVAALALTAENRLLQYALWQALTQETRIARHCPAHARALEIDARGVRLELDDGHGLEAQLIIGADGARSWVRTHAGIEARERDYGQLGLVANFATEHPHDGVAYQWFQGEAVLAYLPLPGRRISIVWSLPRARAEALAAAPIAELEAEVQAAGGGPLGRLACMTPPALFPLYLIQPEHLVRPGVALIGDAAHQVHPLAGQGVNLGFADARTLAAVLAARGPRPCGDRWLLRRYERARREDILAMQLVTDGLVQLFARREPPVARLRNAGLALTNRLPWVKRRLIRQALGDMSISTRKEAS